MSAQIHEKFRSFIGKTFDEATANAELFASTATVSAKSISVLQDFDSWIVSLGYVEQADESSVKIIAEAFPEFDTEDQFHEQLDDLLTSFSKGKNVTCHSLYVDADGDLHVAFLVAA